MFGRILSRWCGGVVASIAGRDARSACAVAACAAAIAAPAVADITIHLERRTFGSLGFALEAAAGSVSGTLTGASINVVLDASTAQTRCNDLCVYLDSGTWSTGGALQIGGATNLQAGQRLFWPNGGSSAPGTTCVGSVSVGSPIAMANSGLNIWFGNGYSATGTSGTWSGTITLHGVSFGAADNYFVNFEGLGNFVEPGNFYNGGPGGSFGITFSTGCWALIDSDIYGNSGNFANEPSPSTAMLTNNQTRYVNVAGGFTSASFYYSLVSGSAAWAAFSLPNGGGTQLASGTLAALGSTSGDPSGQFSVWALVSASVPSGAQSIRFTGPSVYFDNFTFQNTCNASTPPVIVSYTPSINVQANSNCTAPLPDFRPTVVATDNCTPTSALFVTQSPVAGTVVGIGATFVTITVRDSDNNSASVQAVANIVDAGGGITYYRDADGDGYGNPAVFQTVCGNAPTGYVTNSGDCNDADASLNPTTPWYRDIDGDGFGAAVDGVVHQCLKPTGYVRVNGDNCTTIANPDQADANGNGFGDACELARGDLNLDGVVNGSDIPLLLNHWGMSNPPLGDLNRDGTVNGADFALMLSAWGSGPG